MKELVLRSYFIQDGYRLTIKAHEDGGIVVNTATPFDSAGLTLSADDTHKLRDFLNNRLGEQAPEHMGTDPWVYLEQDSKGNNWWSSYPTRERAQEFAMKRVGFGLETQMLARCHQTLVPVTVTTTSYKWKDIS